MIIPILSGLSILLFANKFYDYDTLKTLLPILKNIDSSLFAIMLLGGSTFFFFFLQNLLYIFAVIQKIVILSVNLLNTHLY